MRRILLVQLPIPPVGPEPIRGNVPLAAGYLKLFARHRGLESHYDIQILPTLEANTLSDQGLVEAILARDPWMVGFTCYLWNIERTLWIASRIQERDPTIRILIGGPEVTLDNAWVLEHPAVDYAAIGEGEQTFSELLTALGDADEPTKAIPGLWVQPLLNRKRSSDSIAIHSPFPTPHSAFPSTRPLNHSALPIPHSELPFIPRRPLLNLNEISSPYLAGILDAADEEMLLLETIRGCIFKCKFCYYPKSYDDLYFVSEEKIVANLEHAQRRGAKEVVLLDPTLNQRRNFAEFLRLLAHCNPDRQFTYFGELRAEGITPQIAELLHQANFTEVEIGLQSIDPLAMELMDRHNNLKAFERGARAMLDLGIKVKVDLIIGLPGDTVDSVRRGIDYVHRSGLYSQVQVFNLAVLPGTSFRQEAEQLGLVFQDRPPYYVLQTPTLSTQQMYELMAEAEDAFETEFDPLPEVQIDFSEPRPSGRENHKAATAGRGGFGDLVSHWLVDLDDDKECDPPPAAVRSQAFTLWLRCSNFHAHRHHAAELVDRLLTDNPFTTLQIVLEPISRPSPSGRGQGEGAECLPETLTAATCDAILQAAFRHPTYLDRFCSVQPGRLKGAKRIVVGLSKLEGSCATGQEWLEIIRQYATIITSDSKPLAEPPTVYSRAM
jgi:radical SAM superfamily enzyme YgiQ (UPF0313 family)